MPRCSQYFVLLDDLLMDTQQDNPITVPYDVQEILYDMTITYLIEKPADMLTFCLNYMHRLKTSRHTGMIEADKEPQEVLEDYWKKREAIIDVPLPETKDHLDPEPKPKEEERTLIGLLVDIFPFKFMNPQLLKLMVRHLREIQVEIGERIAMQGQPSKTFYLIKKGLYTAFVKDGEYVRPIRSYENSGYFCELALLYESQNEETFIANSEGSLWTLDRTVYKDVIIKYEKNKRSSYDALLKRIPVFSELTDRERTKLIDTIESHTYEKGEFVCKAGAPVDTFYIVEWGYVLVTVEDPVTGGESTRKVAEMGDYFGEDAFLQSESSLDLTAKTLDRTMLALIRVEEFERLLGPYVDIMKRKKK